MLTSLTCKGNPTTHLFPGAPHLARLVLMPDASDKRVESRVLGSMEDIHGDGAGRDDSPVGKPDPLAEVLFEQPLPRVPVAGLVPAPIRVDLPGDLGR
jgi:hypothetical protein